MHALLVGFALTVHSSKQGSLALTTQQPRNRGAEPGTVDTVSTVTDFFVQDEFFYRFI